MTEIRHYVGVLSGTSMDAVSAVLVRFEREKMLCVATHQVPYPDELRAELRALSHGTENEIERMGVADRRLGRIFAKTVMDLAGKASVSPEQVCAIGSHGQTIRHRPNGLDSFSIQIADPNTIAEQTNIAVVADLRRRDIACGGEGAPLAPAFHAHAFGKEGCVRMVVNIGGISNLSVLDGKVVVGGFDCGHGNLLLDEWCMAHLGQAYDNGGAWAKSGNVDEKLLALLDTHPFLRKSVDTPPYSTGREEFNMAWLRDCLAKCPGNIEPADVQATLSEWTAKHIAEASASFASRGGGTQNGSRGNGYQPGENALYVCGGGAYNGDLMSRLRRLCEPGGVTVEDTSALGIPPDQVEGAAFAWLAMCYMEGISGNVPTATGALKPCVLGCLYPARIQLAD